MSNSVLCLTSYPLGLALLNVPRKPLACQINCCLLYFSSASIFKALQCGSKLVKMLSECQTAWLQVRRIVTDGAVSLLTLTPPSMTKVPYANSLDPDETPSNSASHPDPSCLTLRQHFHQL